MIKIGTRFYHDVYHKNAKAHDIVVGTPTAHDLNVNGLMHETRNFYWVKYIEEYGKGRECRMLVSELSILEKLKYYGKVSPITMKRRRI